MGLLNKAKLLVKKKTEMAKADAKFKINLELEKLFASIPKKIDLLKIAAMAALALILSKILKGGYSKEDTAKFLRTDIRAKTILKFTAKEIDNSNLSQILLACHNEASIDNIPILNDNLTAPEILNTISSLNNIEKEINKNKVQQLKLQINSALVIAAGAYLTYNFIKDINIKEGINAEKEALKLQTNQFQEKLQTYKYLLQHNVDMTKDLLTKTVHPSKYRTKYIQKLIRNTYALIKSEYEEIKDSTDKRLSSTKKQFEDLMNSFKNIDDILIAITVITSLYLINRKKLHKHSSQTLKVIATDAICQSDFEPFNVSINKIPFTSTFNCPVVIDDVIVPHRPLEERLKNTSCEIIQNEETTVEATVNEDLVTMAIIQNNRKTDALISFLPKDSFVDQKTKIANLGTQSIFSPIPGYIDEITTNKIVLRDISEPPEDYLTSLINSLNEKYATLNSAKVFLKYYYIKTLYPIMLSISIVDDASTHDQYTGINKQYAGLLLTYNLINEEHDNKIKQIAGQDNVEKHAKNETLNEIKKQIETEDEKFYKHLNLLRDMAQNAAKLTKAKSNEYDLFEYYSLNLGPVFNGIENPTKLEIEIRDKINEFIRKRYVLDGYNKDKLAQKINEGIKEIEKGLSLGDWFKKAMAVYSQNKKLSDLKSWLMGLANDNRKLEGNDKLIAVNRVMFLFELYLNADTIVKKYNLIKKETTQRTETVKEGNYLFTFVEALWKEYLKLPVEIEELQKLIDSISMFTTYSITEYNGKQARLYSIAEPRTCESEEIDPYMNPKSKYGYGDIQYWLKYCSYATLASVTNPAMGWSTGWIFPTPIPFPVVYVPIKPISTSYGVILLGLTICGIYLFPWSLFVNLNTNFVTPFGDPTIALKNEIQALKKEISDQIANLKKISIKPLMDKAKENVDKSKETVKRLKSELKNLKANKPTKYTTTSLEYAKAYGNWVEGVAIYYEAIATESGKLWKYQTEYAILRDAYSGGKSVKGITSSLDSTEKSINNQMNTLNSMADNVNKSIAALPIAISPDTANFGLTAKNPKPVINIAGDLDDNINYNVLNNITDKFKLKNADLLSSNYETKLKGTVLDYKAYKNTLIASMSLITTNDPFPSYQLLRPTNIAWLKFLYKDFVPTGAKTYGFPGQWPLPSL